MQKHTHTHGHTHTHTDSNEYPIVAFSKKATIIRHYWISEFCAACIQVTDKTQFDNLVINSDKSNNLILNSSPLFESSRSRIKTGSLIFSPIDFCDNCLFH